MFLITTADEHTWRSDRPILFLGEWCKRHSRRSIWSKLDHEILPYHWDNREQMHKDYEYLKLVYEKYLAKLAENLNDLHQSDHSVRYWRIIVGPWLHYFTSILYDRYLSIQAAIREQRVSSTCIVAAGPTDWVPRMFDEFAQFYVSDEWNHFVYGTIIKHLDCFAYTSIAPADTNAAQIRPSPPLSRRLPRLFRNIYRFLPNHLSEIVLVSSYLKPMDLARLHVSLAHLPAATAPQPDLSAATISLRLRDQLHFGQASDGFEELLTTLIPMQIPVAYLEGFSHLRDHAVHMYPPKAKTILTANGFWADETFKLWAAERTDQGARLFIGQHGGAMGTASWYQSEDHQIAISDRFYSWGWRSPDDDRVRPLSGGVLIHAKRSRRHCPDGPVLCVLASLPRYFYHMCSFPAASQYLRYIDDQITFAKSLTQTASDSLKFRLDSSGRYGWELESRFRDHDLAGKVDDTDVPLLRRLGQCRLCVVTHNATVFLETFAANFPTLIFWNPRYYEVRAQARPYFDGLRRADILHDSPESAAALLNEIYGDPMRWWQQPARQSAITNFSRQFAHTSDDWVHEWKEELQSHS